MEVWIWLIIIIALSILEAATVSLVSIWFIASALVSLILSLFNVDFIICFGVFVVLGLILMILTRKTLVRLISFNKEKTNIDRIVGKKGVVTEKIEKNKVGEVKVEGKRWSAYSDEVIEEGALVKILEIDSVKLKVKKWEE